MVSGEFNDEYANHIKNIGRLACQKHKEICAIPNLQVSENSQPQLTLDVNFKDVHQFLREILVSVLVSHVTRKSLGVLLGQLYFLAYGALNLGEAK